MLDTQRNDESVCPFHGRLGDPARLPDAIVAAIKLWHTIWQEARREELSSPVAGADL